MIVGHVTSQNKLSVTDIKPACGICGRLPVINHNLCEECAEAIMRAVSAMHRILEEKR